MIIVNEKSKNYFKFCGYYNKLYEFYVFPLVLVGKAVVNFVFLSNSNNWHKQTNKVITNIIKIMYFEST